MISVFGSGVRAGYPGIKWDFPVKMAATHSDNSWKDHLNWYDLAQIFIPFIVGVLLFVNGRNWAVKLALKQSNAALSLPDTDKLDT